MSDLPEVAVLLGDSGRLYLRRLPALLLIQGAGGAMSLLSALAPFGLAWLWTRGGASAVPWVLATVAALSGVLWFASWMQVAMLEAIFDREDRGIGRCYRASWPKIIPFSWVCLLAFVFVTGGSFWLLLPGAYLFGALFFAPLINVAEGLEGLPALERSLDLVWGRWWGVAGRLALAAIAASLPGLVPVAGPVLGAVAAPYAFVCACLLYERLREAPAKAAVPPWRSKLILAVAALGLAWPTFMSFQLARALPEVLPILKDEFSALAAAGADPARAQAVLRLLETGGPGAMSAAYQLMRSSGTVAAPEAR